MPNYSKISILVLIFFSIEAFPQVDTTLVEFWPLGKGDKWQYHDENGELSTNIQVVSEDTLLPNGFYYAKIGVPPNFSTGYSFDRIDSLLRVQWGGPCDTCTQILDSCGGTAPAEYSIYHLGDTVGTIWNDCVNWNGFLSQPYVRYAGVQSANIFGQIREVMVFQFGYYSSAMGDYVFESQDLLVRGIGLYRREYWWSGGGYVQLTGAIVNGVQYGNIVSVENSLNHIPEQPHLYQNYPNPFNPVTIIKYEIPISTNATLKVFNMLGQEIITLRNEFHLPGIYEVKFDASNFSSGVYVCLLHTERARLSKRMLLIK